MKTLIASTLTLALTAAFGLSAVPAYAKAGTAEEQSERGVVSASSPASAPQSSEVKYCFIDTITGSHIRTKVCKTKKQWSREGVDLSAK